MNLSFNHKYISILQSLKIQSHELTQNEFSVIFNLLHRFNERGTKVGIFWEYAKDFSVNLQLNLATS